MLIAPTSPLLNRQHSLGVRSSSRKPILTLPNINNQAISGRLPKSIWLTCPFALLNGGDLCRPSTCSISINPTNTRAITSAQPTTLLPALSHTPTGKGRACSPLSPLWASPGNACAPGRVGAHLNARSNVAMKRPRCVLSAPALMHCAALATSTNKLKLLSGVNRNETLWNRPSIR